MGKLATARLEDPVVVVEVAKAGDTATIKRITDAAYSKYIEPLGMLPAAMKVQYDTLVEARKVYVLRVGGDVVGSVILSRGGGGGGDGDRDGDDGDSVTVNNLVVAPAAQGRGFGRLLMEYAEDKALAQGLAAVTLFANEKMYDNIAWYTKIGFVEMGRRNEDGFNRVYFRKNLV